GGCLFGLAFFFSSRRRHTRFSRDWSSDVCSSDLQDTELLLPKPHLPAGRATAWSGRARPGRWARWWGPSPRRSGSARRGSTPPRSEERRGGEGGAYGGWARAVKKEERGEAGGERE